MIEKRDLESRVPARGFGGPHVHVQRAAYALVDPRSRAVRYVGVTMMSLSVRLAGHLSNPGYYARREWLEGLRARGLRPIIVELGTYPLEIAAYAERVWYLYYGARGAELVNTSAPSGDRFRTRLADVALQNWRRTRTGPRLHHVIVLGDRAHGQG